MALSDMKVFSPEAMEDIILCSTLFYEREDMNTKSMMNHLKKNGVEFAKCEESGWDSKLEGEVIAHNTQLGNLIWETAEKLGETI